MSSLSSGYVRLFLLTPNHQDEIVQYLPVEAVHRGTKQTTAIQVGFEVTYYEVQFVLKVSIVASGISVVLGIPLNSKAATLNIPHATPLNQPNENGSSASVHQFRQDYIAFATDKSQYAKFVFATSKQCFGTNRIKLCRKGFSTATDVTFFSLNCFFDYMSVPILRNCHIESILLSDAPQVCTSQMVFVKSFHGTAIFRWWTIPILMAPKCPLLTVKYVFFTPVARQIWRSTIDTLLWSRTWITVKLLWSHFSPKCNWPHICNNLWVSTTTQCQFNMYCNRGVRKGVFLMSVRS